MVRTWFIEMELAAGEDGETSEGEFGDVSELIVTVLVVSIADNVLVVGLVVGGLRSLTA